MSIRRVCSLLCTLICASLLMLSLGSQPGTAQNKNRELLPVVDGPIFDQSPFDGVGDGIDENFPNTTFLNAGLLEIRPAIEFDLAHINPNRIESATLRIVNTSTGILPGTLTIPVQVFGYRGDGAIQFEDFSAGSLVAEFDSLATPDDEPVFVDVTAFIQSMRPAQPRIVGFTLRTNVHGAQLNYGSLEFGPAPTLMLTLK
jgi:hypothetical protein